MKKIKRQTIFILSISSGIGLELAKRYLKEGFFVIGTYRDRKYVQGLVGHPNCRLFVCDITKLRDVANLVAQFKRYKFRWDTFISCVGVLQPLTRFFETDFDEWSRSIQVNSTDQLRVLHALYKYRSRKGIGNVVFFAGSGTNSVVVNMSAYISSKIFLMKMCEQLDAENKDLNVFIVGPGWTKTKSHFQVVADEETPREKYEETIEFLFNRKGTDFQDIYDCIQWLCRCGKKVSGGRNFSVVFDPWMDPDNKALVAELKKDSNMYKLRRCKNDFLTQGDNNNGKT